jgi:hypothetical protein
VLVTHNPADISPRDALLALQQSGHSSAAEVMAPSLTSG